MNAIQLILTQHSRIKKYLLQLSKSKTPLSLEKTFNKISEYLTSHETMEQKVWYPFLKKNISLKSTITLLIAEEKSAAKEIAKIKKIKSKDNLMEKIMKLNSSVAQHAKDEETKLLPKVKKLIDDSDLKIIGKKMREVQKKWDMRQKA